MPLSLPFLAIGPRVSVESARIETRTGWIVAILTLGAWLDHVTVDSREKTVAIRRRRFWLFPSVRIVRFSEIREVAYSLIDHGNYLEGERGFHEIFDIALTLHSDEEVPLVRFSGDGEYVSDAPIWGEHLADRLQEASDIRGDQQERSLGFVELLAYRIGVPLGSSRYF